MAWCGREEVWGLNTTVEIWPPSEEDWAVSECETEQESNPPVYQYMEIMAL